MTTTTPQRDEDRQKGTDLRIDADFRTRLKKEIWEWFKALLVAVFVVLLIRWFVFTPTTVSGDSMLPNFEDKERIIVNKLIYNLRDPKRGEVIVFHAPGEKDFIKRVIALPGEKIMVKGDQVFVNGKVIEEPYIKEAIENARRKGTLYNRMVNFKVTPEGIQEAEVPAGHYFVLGDNRSKSRDSRDPEVGFISEEDIVGRADFIFWPIHKWRWISHGK